MSEFNDCTLAELPIQEQKPVSNFKRYLASQPIHTLMGTLDNLKRNPFKQPEESIKSLIEFTESLIGYKETREKRGLFSNIRLTPDLLPYKEYIC